MAGASLTTKGRLIPAVLVGVSAVLFLIYRNTFAVILLIVVILLAIALAEYSRRSPAPLAASIELADPRLITSANQQSFVALPSEVLHLDKGAVSIWAYLQDFGTGIRELKINRYLLAHATHENHPYQNVFSLRRGATKWDPPWRAAMAVVARGRKRRRKNLGATRHSGPKAGLASLPCSLEPPQTHLRTSDRRWFAHTRVRLP